ncbi:MAG: TonB-dependent siderophore receptor [Proteobacteria bacterium]|nr:TonB-dependent siderophore receptor [Pseudomonadota bacterium]
MREKRKRWHAAGLLWVGACHLVHADDKVQEVEFIQVQARSFASSTTASLSATPLFELPLSATTLSAATFADRLPKDIADLADYSAGVSRRSNYWGIDTPTFQLRGFNAGDSTAYYKDGFRYQGRGPLSMANIEAVEILRGPQSALYGWSEPGGAVQLRVKQPTAQSVRTASLQVDGWGKTSSTVDLGGALSETSRFRFVAAREQGGSFRDQQNGEQTLLAPSIAWDFSGGRQLSLSLEWLDDKRSTDYGIPAINGAPADVPVSRAYTEEWGKQHSQSTRLASRWQQPAWEGDLSLALSYYNFNYLEYRDAEPCALSGTSVKRWYESYPERYRWLTGYLDWSREFVVGNADNAAAHRISTRLETARESRSLDRGVLDEYAPIDLYRPIYGQAWTPTADFSVYDQTWTNQSVGLVFQDEIRTGNWTWLLGTRFAYLRQVFDYAEYSPIPLQDHSIQRDRSITPRVGVNWRAMPWLALYTNYSAGAMATLPQSRSFGGGAFSPLASKQVEAGVKLQPVDDDWLASAAVFNIESSNVLTRDPEHPTYSIQTGVQRSRGLEVEWQGNLAPRWRLTAQGTWLDAHLAEDQRYAPGNRLPYVPRFGGSAWLTHRLAAEGDGRWSVSGGLVHQGDRYADFANNTRIPGFTRIDLGATYREKKWTTTLALENATDRRYYVSGVENRPAVIYPGAPRTVSMKLAYDFR